MRALSACAQGRKRWERRQNCVAGLLLQGQSITASATLACEPNMSGLGAWGEDAAVMWV